MIHSTGIDIRFAYKMRTDGQTCVNIMITNICSKQGVVLNSYVLTKQLSGNVINDLLRQQWSLLVILGGHFCGHCVDRPSGIMTELFYLVALRCLSLSTCSRFWCSFTMGSCNCCCLDGLTLPSRINRRSRSRSFSSLCLILFFCSCSCFRFSLARDRRISFWKDFSSSEVEEISVVAKSMPESGQNLKDGIAIVLQL